MDSDNPYLIGSYAPVDREVEGLGRVIAGEVPNDFGGVHVRNGPNPRFAPRGRYHWFDGDGMIHAARIEAGEVHYRNRWVRTKALEREIAEGRALWGGVMESTRDNPKGPPYKDTSNTDVVFHAGALKTTWWLSGQPYRVDARTLETFGCDAPSSRDSVTAHPKVDDVTGELMFFGYGMRPPFMHYGVLGPDGTLVHRADIPLPGPRLPHDMAITENYSVLMDLPMQFDVEAAMSGRWRTIFPRDVPARFGVIPRRGTTDQLRWFEAESCYIYHSINAWEEGDEIVMVGCRVDDPLPKPDPADGPHAAMMANLRVGARLYKWRFDLKTGATREEALDDRNTEFPTIHLGRTGRKTRYAYNVALADARTLVFEALVKYDTDSGAAESLSFGPGRLGSEASFAPRRGATSEDDGYLLSFVHDERENRSELWIVDAKEVARGPVARVEMPARVPLGFHAFWVPEEKLSPLPR